MKRPPSQQLYTFLSCLSRLCRKKMAFFSLNGSKKKYRKQVFIFYNFERTYTQVNTIITISHGYHPIIIGKNHSLGERCVEIFFNKNRQKILFKTFFCLNLQTKQIKSYRTINISSLYSPFGTRSVPLDSNGKAI